MSTSVYKTCQREGIATLGRICTTIVRKSLVTVLHAHMPDVVLKLRRISAERRKDSPLSSEKMTSTEKVSSFLSSTRFEGDAFGPVNASKSFESVYLVQSTSPPYNLIPHDFGGSLQTSKTVIYSA